MTNSALLAVVLGLTALGFFFGRQRSRVLSGGVAGQKLHSLPSYYGLYVALWCGIPSLLLFSIFQVLEPAFVRSQVLGSLPPEALLLDRQRLDLLYNDIRNLAAGVTPLGGANPDVVQGAERYRQLSRLSDIALAVGVIGLCLGAGWVAWRRVQRQFRARVKVERAIEWLLIACSTVAIFTTIGILLSVVVEAMLFFRAVPPWEFLFGQTWSPQTAIRADQAGSSGAFGAIPLFAGTLLISSLAMVVAVPLGLMSAIYLSEYASARVRSVAKPMLEVLAGIPTVVYGYFAALTVGPLLRQLGVELGLDVSSESALGAGLVMGIMIIPFVSSLSDDVINAVPQALRDGSYGLGATQSETIRQVVLPAALPGIVGGVLLAVSRAIGETMIVVMAAGLAANLTANPLEAVTTVTVQIVTLLVGDQEFDSPKTLAAFALGLVLFVVTLILNIVALKVVRRYREQYE